MILIRKKPVTPSQRFLKNIDMAHLKKNRLKNLSKGLKKTGGRNNLGRITSFQKGGGHKRSYRFIDFERKRLTPGFLKHLEYDPNRSAFIGCVYDLIKKDHYYIIAPKNLKIGTIITNNSKADFKTGNKHILKEIPIGSIIHNISLYPNKNGVFARSAVTFAKLIKKTEEKANLRLPSG
jgi:large subunit ribosomal protein L2